MALICVISCPNESTIVVTEEVAASSAQMKAPEPEAPIQPAACRLVLLEHIEQLQSRLEGRLEQLETRLEQLEGTDLELSAPVPGEDSSGDDSSPRCTRTKEMLRMLQRDLASVGRISNYVTSE